MPPFPPGKSGGLIEARCPCLRAAVQPRRFRRVNPAASLKPDVPALAAPEAPEFPPGKSGGLIEAPWHGSFAARPERFRRVNPAASLKPCFFGLFLGPASQFPPGKSGGLIEASSARTCTSMS